MRIPPGAMVLLVALMTTASAQSPAPPANGTAPPAATAAPSAAAVPVPATKRFACQTAAQGMQGQDRRDQVQLCIAEARVDCLKQAIDKKIIGNDRRGFIKNCVE
jgi:hypothetical protein